jgi:undecaprenyl-diphosphatase
VRLRDAVAPGPGRGQQARATGVAAVAAAVLLVVTYDVLAHRGLTLLDARTQVWVLEHRGLGLDRFLRLVDGAGTTLVAVPVLAVVAGLLARRRRSWAPVLVATGGYLAAAGLQAGLAGLVQRRRPPVADWVVAAHGWGFPAAHATSAILVYGLVALLLGAGAGRRTRLALGLLAGAVGALVAVAEVYLGAHWSSDVVAALALGTTVLALCSVAGTRIGSPARRTSPRPLTPGAPALRVASGNGP